MNPKLVIDINGNVLPVVRIGATQVIDGTSASAATTNAISADSDSVVRVACLADVYVAVAATPTATANSMVLPAGSVEWILVPAGMKIAVLGGKLWISLGV